MAQVGQDVHTELIPYDANREVVLRHADSIVVYDQGRMVLRNANKDVDTQNGVDCPTCHRPWHNAPRDQEEDGTSAASQPNFINHDYFRLLRQSLPGSAESSSPPSPRRRLVQPVHLGRTPTVRPPPDAEFVGTSPAPPSQAHGISAAAFAPKYFEKFFQVEKELGRGGRGVVLLVKHVLDGVTLGSFACKRVPIGDDHAWLEKVLVEVQLLQTLSHQNLVSYRHVWLQDFQLSSFTPSVPCAFILQQYCNGGDLHNYVCGPAQALTSTQDLKERIRRRSKGESELPKDINEPRKLHFDEIYSFFRDITSGLQFLHLNGFIHRDLKPSNCLLHRTGRETRVLVSDFGEVQYESTMRKSTGATGTISYCAPEVLRRIAPDGPYGNFTFKSDIFSLGMILYFLCFATLPYRFADVLHEEREDVESLRAEITQWEGFFDDERRLRPELPEKLYAFLKRLLSIQPEDRPTADEVNNGIRTGVVVDDRPESSNKRNSIALEELTPGRRIVPLDSPAMGTSTRKATQTSALAHPLSTRRRPLSREPPAIDTSQHNADGQTSPQPTGGESSRKREIVLHPHVSSPRDEQAPEFPTHSPLLLLPPELPAKRAFGFHSLVRSPSTKYLLRTLVLTGKLVSLIQPCASRGINPIVVYPMMLLAIIEFAITRYALIGGSVTMLAHLIVLGTALKFNTLCSAPTWDDA
jgi:serine/threonine protein kinase